jgi:hypothetical protein
VGEIELGADRMEGGGALRVDHAAVEIDEPPAAVVFEGPGVKHAGLLDADAVEALHGVERDPVERGHTK